MGGGFGGKLFVRADAVLAALGARAARRPVKVALPRPLMFNNTTHRPATIQRIRIGTTPDGKITAIGHESWSGDLAGGRADAAVRSTRLCYAGANRMTATRLAVLDLPEANAMRAPGDATGSMALEIAIDEIADKAMTMGVGAALMEELAVDKRHGFFVNHDLAGYEVPVHADIPHQEVIFLDETDPTSSPMKAKGVGELGICGIAAAIANAIYHATGVRVRDYPITLDKLLDRLPEAGAGTGQD